MKKLFVSVITGLSLIFLVACDTGESPESVVQKFFEESMQGDIDKAIALLDWDDKEKDPPRDQFEAEGKVQQVIVLFREVYANDKISEFITDGVEYNQDKTRATVNVAFTTEGREEHKGPVYLVRRDGKWKILVQTFLQ